MKKEVVSLKRSRKVRTFKSLPPEEQERIVRQAPIGSDEYRTMVFAHMDDLGVLDLREELPVSEKRGIKEALTVAFSSMMRFITGKSLDVVNDPSQEKSELDYFEEWLRSIPEEEYDPEALIDVYRYSTDRLYLIGKVTSDRIGDQIAQMTKTIDEISSKRKRS